MATALPRPSRNQSPGQHLQISRRFIEHARDELANGERLQASEKVWGAAGHAIAAYGKERGWLTEKYPHKETIAGLIADEFDDAKQFERIYISFNAAHINFYQNHMEEYDIMRSIDQVGTFVGQVEQLMKAEPQPFTVTSEAQAHRIREVTGHAAIPGRTYTDGFINRRRLARWERQWANSRNGDA